jgi:hypothetical protein
MRGLWVLFLAGMMVVAGCNSNGKTTAAGTTELAGTWSAFGTGTCTSGCTAVAASYQVTLVASPCSVTTTVGTFSVQGSVCFIANNNSGAGSITGVGVRVSGKNLGQGVLVGAPADPVPDGSTLNLMFVSAAYGGRFTEFTGTATVTGGKISGSGACSTASTLACTGTSATFAGTHE